MKFGDRDSKKTIAAGALFVVAVVMFIHMIAGSSGGSKPAPAETVAVPPPPAHQSRIASRRGAHGKNEKSSGPLTPSLDPRLHLGDLKEAEETTYEGNGRNIFMATEEPKQDIPQPVAPGMKGADKVANNVTPPPAVKPGPPPINLKFFGFASGPDHKRVFLAQGDDVFVASEGDIVQRRYKIVKINNNNIEVLDVLSNNRQTIPLVLTPS